MFLRSYRQQNLLVEFASLKHVQPQGLYLSLTPGDSTLWSGILFVRKGPYAPAVFRFRISFPSSYPLNPPLITFVSDAFHPLLAPLTTASFGSSFPGTDSDASASEVRLPPGAFSLSHGFPQWRQRRGSIRDTTSAKQATPNTSPRQPRTERGDSVFEDPKIHVVDVLQYMRSSFEDESILDNLPFEAAGNAGAWYAWRAHRAKAGVKFDAASASNGHRRQSSKEKAGPRHPSEWNWEGVWVARARKAVQASLSEPALYGTGGVDRDDEVHFRTWSDESEEIENMQKEMRYHLRLHE
ncbi:MAG: hypothetical protein M1828_002581 [Chrysothrix sp. TS-e1954]|nr:MAG: hypothetical protein M1828_002581 [Chrysothrix sp. TS-e1954]